MKQKSLRQLAKELGVSHSYLSQVKHGKRPAGQKVVSKVVSKMVSSSKHGSIAFDVAQCYNASVDAELCSGSTGDFGSPSPGSNPGSAASMFPDSSMVERAAVNR